MTPDRRDEPKVQKETLDGLTPSRLAEWLRDRLHNRDRLLFSRGSEPAYYLVESLYQILEPETQHELGRAATRLLHEAAAGDEWNEDAILALLRLADPLLLRSIFREDALEAVLEIVESQSSSDNVRFAAAQALVTLDYLDSPDFWQQLLAKGDRYAPAVVEAIARTSFGSLEHWLLQNLREHSAIEDALIGLLPFLIGERRGDEVMRLLIGVEPELSEVGISLVRSFAQREKLILSNTVEELFSRESDMHASALTLLHDATAADDMEKARAFFERARLFRLELRRQQDLRTEGDGRLLPFWKKYLRCLQAALGKGRYGEKALEEIQAALRQVGSESLIAELPLTAIPEQLFKRIAAALSLTPEHRRKGEDLDKRNRSAPPGATILDALKSLG